MTAVQIPARSNTRADAGTPTAGECSYVGCSRAAVKAHRSKYGRWWWLGCGEHEAAMNKVLFGGQPTDSGQVFTVELGGRR